MSLNNADPGAPIEPGSPLARALGGFGAPPLPEGFAARVLAAADARPVPLPRIRRSAVGRAWRTGRRLALGLAGFGLIATAAAATGLLQQFALPVPSPAAVWASMTGAGTGARPAQGRAAPLPAKRAAPAQVAIDGPVDTPAERDAIFRRTDEIRAGRREDRRVLIDRRIAAELARRTAAGLPVPTPAEEAQLRARVEAAVQLREVRMDAAVAARRETMQRKVENGEAVTRQHIVGRMASGDPASVEALRELRDLPPDQRRAAWRNLPEDQRRALMEEIRARRAARLPKVAPATPSPSPIPEASPGE